jgi:hypothetical protein
VIIQSGYITVCYREYGDYLRFERIADKALIMTDDLIYNERVSSNKTEGLFLALWTGSAAAAEGGVGDHRSWSRGEKIRNSKWQIAFCKSEEKLNLAIYDPHISRRRSISNGTEAPISTDEKSGWSGFII